MAARTRAVTPMAGTRRMVRRRIVCGPLGVRPRARATLAEPGPASRSVLRPVGGFVNETQSRIAVGDPRQANSQVSRRDSKTCL
jgi:hypothetical protein